MERMIDSCIAADVTPIVLTPFVYGSRYSARNGVTYANALRELIAEKPGAVLVDCIEVLRAYPKRAVLQHDGFHLSQNGHAAVGLAIAQRITSHLQRSHVNKNLRTPSGVQQADGIAKLPAR
jgi:lysophospholipase L1-like esterase